jgi:hypothetical protein
LGCAFVWFPVLLPLLLLLSLLLLPQAATPSDNAAMAATARVHADLRIDASFH